MLESVIEELHMDKDDMEVVDWLTSLNDVIELCKPMEWDRGGNS